MKSFAFIAILVTISLASCPIWKCSTERMEDTCWYLKKQQKEQTSETEGTKTTTIEISTNSTINVQTEDQQTDEDKDDKEHASKITTKAKITDFDENDEVHVGTWCTDKAKGACYLTDFNENPQGTKCQYPTEQTGFVDQVHISKRLSEKYCNDIKYKDQFKCEKYCIVHFESKDIYTFKFKDCNISMLQQDREDHNSLRNVDWSGCRLDGDCASNSCVCVPNTNGQGRCSVSVYDKFYNNAFQTICDETRASDEFLHDMDEDSCALWILLKLGHHIKAVRSYQKELPCLTNFTDFTSLMTLKDQLQDEFSGKYILLPIGAVIILALIAYCYCKNKNVDEKEEPLLDKHTTKD